VTAGGNAIQTEFFADKSEPQAEHMVRIEVIDDGPGIPKSEARRIFEPFFSTKKNKQCAGLGLAVVIGCAKQFGGALRYHTEKGETVFEMTVPAQKPELLSAAA
jgi:C4-dicarboxylate-specific signal transduction histidine kinase